MNATVAGWFQTLLPYAFFATLLGLGWIIGESIFRQARRLVEASLAKRDAIIEREVLESSGRRIIDSAWVFGGGGDPREAVRAIGTGMINGHTISECANRFSDEVERRSQARDGAKAAAEERENTRLMRKTLGEIQSTIHATIHERSDTQHQLKTLAILVQDTHAKISAIKPSVTQGAAGTGCEPPRGVIAGAAPGDPRGSGIDWFTFCASPPPGG